MLALDNQQIRERLAKYEQVAKFSDKFPGEMDLSEDKGIQEKIVELVGEINSLMGGLN